MRFKIPRGEIIFRMEGMWEVAFTEYNSDDNTLGCRCHKSQKHSYNPLLLFELTAAEWQMCVTDISFDLAHRFSFNCGKDYYPGMRTIKNILAPIICQTDTSQLIYNREFGMQFLAWQKAADIGRWLNQEVCCCFSTDKQSYQFIKSK